MERLSLEITNYDSNVNGEYKVQNQLSFSVENIRTMEDWHEVATKISTLMITLNGGYEIGFDEKAPSKSFSEALAAHLEKNKHKQRNPQ